MNAIKRSAALSIIVAAVLGLNSVEAHNGDEHTLTQAQELFKPLPKDFATTEYPITPERVELGKALFFDPRFSLDGRVSCAGCHQPGLYGTDGIPKSFGAQSRPVPRNASTILNTAGQFVQHFGGNRKDVEEQAVRALTGAVSYANPDIETAMARIKAIPGYAPLFAKAFPDSKEPMSPENFGKAVGAYERTLVSAGPFDRYLKGDVAALSARAKLGMSKFIQTGCGGCHNGALLGGTMYQKFGLVVDYWTLTKSADIDKGRFNDTKNEADTYMFKVPPLRNIAKTAPYFHDGSVAKLSDAVRVMALAQLGKKLGDEDVEDIVAFLESLTGEIPANFLSAPVLPEGAFTPMTAQK